MSNDSSDPIAVLGGGAVSQTMAADLSLAGHDVRLFELPQFEENIDRIRETGEIEVTGDQHNYQRFKRGGTAEIDIVTTDITEAVQGVEYINLCVPAVGQKAFFRELLPELSDGQVVSLFPDSFGSLILENMMDESDINADVTIGGWTTSPYVSRVDEPGRVNCVMRTYRVMGDTLPSGDAEYFSRVSELPIFDGATHVEQGDTVLEIGLMNINPVIHVPPSLLNVGAIENAGRDERIYGDPDAGYSVYREGLSPSVAKTQIAYWDEICEISERADVDYVDYDENDFMTKGSLVSVEFDTPFFDQIFLSFDSGPSSVQHRFFTEDLAITNAYYELGQKFDVETPTLETMLSLGSLVCERDFRSEGRSLEEMGLADMSKAEIRSFIKGE